MELAIRRHALFTDSPLQVKLLSELGNTSVLANAMLVGGVTSLVRSQNPDAAGGDGLLELIHHALDAMGAFYAAELMLRRVLGESSELSIFTHGNLGETYIHTCRELTLGLVHLELSCSVAITVFGLKHPNSGSKLSKMISVLELLDLASVPLVRRIRAGDVADVHNVRRFPAAQMRRVLKERGLVEAARRMGCQGLADPVDYYNDSDPEWDVPPLADDAPPPKTTLTTRTWKRTFRNWASRSAGGVFLHNTTIYF